MAASVWIASSIGAPSSCAQRADRADNAARHGAAQPEWVADRVHLLPHRSWLESASVTGCKIRRINLQQRQVVHLVCADHLGRVVMLVAQLHLDAAIGALDHVVVRQHVAGLVENESRSLALLRHRAVKKIENHLSRRDVHHRGQHPLVDGDIVLLFGVVRGRGLGLGQFQRRVVEPQMADKSVDRSNAKEDGW